MLPFRTVGYIASCDPFARRARRDSNAREALDELTRHDACAVG
jgi:hypothetical protein